jgi:glucose/arabinose dehydrogenase
MCNFAFLTSSISIKMLPQFFMKSKIFSLSLSIRFITAGMLFIPMIFPKFVLAEKTILQLGSLQLLIPKDIKVNIFAKDVRRARHMAFDDQGVLFLSQTKEGKVVALPDFDKNGESDQKVSIISGHRAPHGLAFVKIKDHYYLYVAEETKVIRLKRVRKPLTYGVPETVVDNIPGGTLLPYHKNQTQ